MNDTENKFWPYRPKVSIIIAIGLAILMMIITAVLSSTISWPADSSTNTVLIGVLLFSVCK